MWLVAGVVDGRRVKSVRPDWDLTGAASSRWSSWRRSIDNIAVVRRQSKDSSSRSFSVLIVMSCLVLSRRFQSCHVVGRCSKSCFVSFRRTVYCCYQSCLVVLRRSKSCSVAPSRSLSWVIVGRSRILFSVVGSSRVSSFVASPSKLSSVSFKSLKVNCGRRPERLFHADWGRLSRCGRTFSSELIHDGLENFPSPRRVTSTHDSYPPVIQLAPMPLTPLGKFGASMDVVSVMCQFWLLPSSGTWRCLVDLTALGKIGGKVLVRYRQAYMHPLVPCVGRIAFRGRKFSSELWPDKLEESRHRGVSDAFSAQCLDLCIRSSHSGVQATNSLDSAKQNWWRSGDLSIPTSSSG